MIGDASNHCWGNPRRAANAAEVIVRDVQDNRNGGSNPYGLTDLLLPQYILGAGAFIRPSCLDEQPIAEAIQIGHRRGRHRAVVGETDHGPLGPAANGAGHVQTSAGFAAAG